MNKKVLVSSLLLSALLVGCQEKDVEKEVKEKPEPLLVENTSFQEEKLFEEVIKFKEGNKELNKDYAQFSVGYNLFEQGAEPDKQFYIDANYPLDDSGENDLYVSITNKVHDGNVANDSYKKESLTNGTEVFYQEISGGHDFIWEKDNNVIRFTSSEKAKKENVLALANEFSDSEKQNVSFDILSKELKFPTLLSKDSVITSTRLTETTAEQVHVKYQLNDNYLLSLTITNDENQYFSTNAEEVAIKEGVKGHYEELTHNDELHYHLAWKENDLMYYLQLTSEKTLKDIPKEQQIQKDQLIEIAKSVK